MQKRESTFHFGSTGGGLIYLIFTICVTILLVLAAFLLFDCKSKPNPASYADLTAHQPIVPGSENGYTYFTAAAKALYYPTNDIFITYIYHRSKTRPVDTNLLKEAILKNQQTFELLRQGIACRVCVPPEFPDHDSRSLDSFCNALFKLRLLWLTKIRLEFDSRQYLEATERCLLKDVR
jgi:hypothetical protein